MAEQSRRKYGVVGGVDLLASADVFSRLVKASSALSGISTSTDVLFESPPRLEPGADGAVTAKYKLDIFDIIRGFEKRGVTTVVLPCFPSHTFIDELKANTSLQIVDMVEAIRSHVGEQYPAATRIGVLASGYMREKQLFERYFASPRFEVVYPRLQNDADPVTKALYESGGIGGAGNLCGHSVKLLRSACDDLVEQGAQVIVPCLAEIAFAMDGDGDGGAGQKAPVINPGMVYAQYAVSGQSALPPPVFKIGVVGGVGPAATVDLLDKIVRNTPAARDQEHIKILVEQNPQIPDRTQNLLADGIDPTIALYVTCKKLEEGHASLIAIPCNTAHAFVDRIQPYLGIPIVNMMTVTVNHLRAAFPEQRNIGLLATSGTIASGVYRKALEAQGLRQVTPEAALQARVMEAIYGEKGVKAGFTSGVCLDDLTAAVEGLAAQGIEVMILGCTELPILLSGGEFVCKSGKRVQLVDPTDILARCCVARARGEIARNS